jgi:uncharacterized protein (DUF427 family)
MNEDQRLQSARALWHYVGSERPSFAEAPGPGQESVWDYLRPPRIASDAREVVIRVGAVEIARSRRALRILETASPPTFYLPPEDVDLNCLETAGGSSFCEWKGRAGYYSVRTPARLLPAACWAYPDPAADYAAIRGHIAFYPSQLECFVAEERVRQQPGEFYGGWITSELVGPFKGVPGSGGW